MSVPNSDRNAPTEITEQKIENDNSTSFNFTQLWQSISKQIIDHTATDTATPINVMGKVYTNMDDFRVAINSKISLTYRFGFEPIPKSEDGPNPLSFIQSSLFNKNLFLNSIQNFPNLIENDNFTNDVGWGCMIRTSQSLLANTFLSLNEREKHGDEISMVPNLQIINMFADNKAAPFSLHNFISVASQSPLKLKPGEWFGPNAASLSIKRLCENYSKGNDTKIPEVKVLISESCDIYDNEIEEVFEGKESNVLLILFPIRLGIDRTNPIYHTSLLHLISLDQSVGIAGGKPSSSFYFLGYQGNSLIYLDPHNPQPVAINGVDSYHTSKYQKLDINDLDPSMLIGILLLDLIDYKNFRQECIGKSNRIVHFHSSEEKGSINRLQSVGSDYKVDFNEMPIDDFININSDSTGDDYIDLGGEISEDNIISPEEETSSVFEGIVNVNKEISPVELFPVRGSNEWQDDLVNLSPKITENFNPADSNSLNMS